MDDGALLSLAGLLALLYGFIAYHPFTHPAHALKE